MCRRLHDWNRPQMAQNSFLYTHLCPHSYNIPETRAAALEIWTQNVSFYTKRHAITWNQWSPEGTCLQCVSQSFSTVQLILTHLVYTVVGMPLSPVNHFGKNFFVRPGLKKVMSVVWRVCSLIVENPPKMALYIYLYIRLHLNVMRRNFLVVGGLAGTSTLKFRTSSV